METPRGEERRKYIRILIDIPFKFSSLDTPTENAAGKITDISVGGTAIETAEELNVGENIEIFIELPNGLKCSFTGQIVREEDKDKIHEYGIKFTKINILDRMKLGDFIMTQLEEQNYILKKHLQRREAEN